MGGRQRGVKIGACRVKEASRPLAGRSGAPRPRGMADLLAVLATVAFVAFMLGLIWALERV
jgi:hypothetical protein